MDLHLLEDRPQLTFLCAPLYPAVFRISLPAYELTKVTSGDLDLLRCSPVKRNKYKTHVPVLLSYPWMFCGGRAAPVLGSAQYLGSQPVHLF